MKTNITIKVIKGDLLILFIGIILFLFSNPDIQKLKKLNITLYEVLAQSFHINQQILPNETLDKYTFIILIYFSGTLLILCSLFCMLIDVLTSFEKDNEDI
jgi:hypothetical protein